MLKQQQNISGDGEVAPQGFGRVARKAPPTFSPDNEIDAAHNFFTTNGYVVLGDCLDQAEIGHLNEFYDRTHSDTNTKLRLSAAQQNHHNSRLDTYTLVLSSTTFHRYTKHSDTKSYSS